MISLPVFLFLQVIGKIIQLSAYLANVLFLLLDSILALLNLNQQKYQLKTKRFTKQK